MHITLFLLSLIFLHPLNIKLHKILTLQSNTDHLGPASSPPDLGPAPTPWMDRQKRLKTLHSFELRTRTVTRSLPLTLRSNIG